MLNSVKNLRSQVCRAAVQEVGVVFLHVGKSLESDVDSLVKELLQKSADTNKFIRQDFYHVERVVIRVFLYGDLSYLEIYKALMHSESYQNYTTEL